MSQNYTLIGATANLTIEVTRTVNLLTTSIRANLKPSRFSERAFVEGDGVELATPFTLFCLIEGSSLGGVSTQMEDVIEFADAARYVRRDSVMHYRRVLGLLNHPPPTRINTVSWELGLTFAPAFGRWTTTQVGLLSTYESTAVKV